MVVLIVKHKPWCIACSHGWGSSIMRANELAELTAFIAVAEARSFRRAAARLNLTPSTLSHSLRALETRLGVRLLNRTTRTVSPTEAGQALLEQIGPAFASVERAVENVNAFSARPHGTVRLNVPRAAAAMILAPMFRRFTQAYPEVTLEVAVNDAFVDIVSGGFDAGIRLGDSVHQDMIAIRVSADFNAAIVGSPGYFATHPQPKQPQDLRDHLCIGRREISSGGLYRWEFEKDGKSLAIPVTGPLVVDTFDTLLITAAMDGVGLLYAADILVTTELADGRLIRVLEDWSPTVPGFHLYYPGRRHVSAALRALIEMIRVEA
jgi:DNA-binding transcriptional LysR family regulator